MPYGIVQADQLQTSVTGGTLGPGNATNFKNRIINGGMAIDQRNAGAALSSAAAQYCVDRWYYSASISGKFNVQQNAGSVTPPVGFTNYLGFTSTSAYTPTSNDSISIQQRIEGYNWADMAYGTVDAKTSTLSFWVRSSLTGTFGGELYGSPGRTYPFTYSIPVANTWTYITITIPGDTTVNSYQTTTSFAVIVVWGLGAAGTSAGGTVNTWQNGNYSQPAGCVNVCATNGATFYITGVQLEVGSNATGFEFRDYGRELIMCQRYFESNYSTGQVAGASLEGTGSIYLPAIDVSAIVGAISFRVWKRTAPTITIYNYSGTAGKTSPYQSTASAGAGTVSGARIGNNGFGWIVDSGTGLTTGQYYWIGYTAAAEL